MPTKENPNGYLCLVLHAHLPFVRHPEYQDFLEERWLYEAITETYIPLIDVYLRALEEGIDFRVTMSLTPPLVSMLTDELLCQRYVRHLENLIELAEKEVVRTRWMPEFNESARMYLTKFRRAYDIFVNKYKCNLVQAFKEFQDAGKLEIITCGATHGFMPLMQNVPEAVRAQVRMSVQHYREQFGRAPRGIWNGECGYYPGLDEILKNEADLKFFFVDAHGILFSDRRPRYGVYAPIYCPSGVAAFGRDLESSQAVWSADVGYPGDFNYREFYRDVGFDLELDYIRPYIHESGMRVSTGMKYYKITNKGIDLADKEPYSPSQAVEKTAEHAGNFMFNREKQAEWLRGAMGRPPIIVCPYDAELFGHWWYEGPSFIDYLIRKMHYDQNSLAMITPSEYLELHPRNQVSTPTLSSWGNNGYCEVWLEGSNDWIYPHLIQAAERMAKAAKEFDNPDPLQRRALNQMGRELLLAQSSDWAFIMKTGTMVDYACKRTRDHIVHLTELYEQLHNGNVDPVLLDDLEYRNNIFPTLDYKIFR